MPQQMLQASPPRSPRQKPTTPRKTGTSPIPSKAIPGEVGPSMGQPERRPAARCFFWTHRSRSLRIPPSPSGWSRKPSASTTSDAFDSPRPHWPNLPLRSPAPRSPIRSKPPSRPLELSALTSNAKSSKTTIARPPRVRSNKPSALSKGPRKNSPTSKPPGRRSWSCRRSPNPARPLCWSEVNTTNGAIESMRAYPKRSRPCQPINPTIGSDSHAGSLAPRTP